MTESFVQYSAADRIATLTPNLRRAEKDAGVSCIKVGIRH